MVAVLRMRSISSDRTNSFYSSSPTGPINPSRDKICPDTRSWAISAISGNLSKSSPKLHGILHFRFWRANFCAQISNNWPWFSVATFQLFSSPVHTDGVLLNIRISAKIDQFLHFVKPKTNFWSRFRNFAWLSWTSMHPSDIFNCKDLKRFGYINSKAVISLETISRYKACW